MLEEGGFHEDVGHMNPLWGQILMEIGRYFIHNRMPHGQYTREMSTSCLPVHVQLVPVRLGKEAHPGHVSSFSQLECPHAAHSLHAHLKCGGHDCIAFQSSLCASRKSDQHLPHILRRIQLQNRRDKFAH